MSSVRAVIAQCAARRIASGNCTVEDVVDILRVDHSDLIREHGQQLAWAQARTMVKRALDHLSENEESGQQTLPGLGLPSAIAVRDAETDEVVYVRATFATWPELEAGLRERDRNVARAQAKRQRYRDALDRLRPYMAADHGVTVSEALRRERGDAA